MKMLTIFTVTLSVGGAMITPAISAKPDMVTILKINAWGGHSPRWDVSGDKNCIKHINYIPSTEAKWHNIGTPSEPPRYSFEVTHTPGCNAAITFNWDGSPNDNDHRSDSFARVEMSQYR